MAEEAAKAAAEGQPEQPPTTVEDEAPATGGEPGDSVPVDAATENQEADAPGADGYAQDADDEDAEGRAAPEDAAGDDEGEDEGLDEDDR